MVIVDEDEDEKNVDNKPNLEENLYKYDFDAYVGMTFIRYRELPNWAKLQIKPPLAIQ